MVTGEWSTNTVEVDDLAIRIDGGQPPTAQLIQTIGAVCERAEDLGEAARVVLHVSGTPDPSWADGLSVASVSKWERAVRRLERLPVATIAVASGDCGGAALDALLATDYRIAARSARLLLPARGGAIWPGMALYRIARQAPGAAAVRRAVLFGVPVEAAEALALHLVHEVTDDLPGALAAAVRLAGTVSGAELAVRRQLLSDAATVSFEDALGVHLAACDRTLRRAAVWSTS